MDLNTTLLDAKFKDSSPIATVERIQDILQQHHIEVEERWHESSVPYCFSLSIKVAGTTFSVNGKGLTREFARASGYGELMERLQLGYARAPGMQKDGSYSFDTVKFPPCSVEQLLQEAPDIYQTLARCSGTSITPAAMLRQFEDEGGVPCVPCYDLTTGQRLHYPNDIRIKVYGSNGYSAGNTPEEAIVQAVSELVERHHQHYALLEGITLPDVPEEVLRRYEVAYRIISYIRDKGFRVIIKDCSLGKKFPVVCAVIINEKSGKYHTHFGAYPKFEIALERSLTESFQGRNIHNIAEFDDFIYNDSEVSSIRAMSHEMTKGAWRKSVTFFFGSHSIPYNAHAGFEGSTNHELLMECIEFFKQEGHRLLVYNAATLGFPAFHVIAPGFSEMHPNRLCVSNNEYRYLPAATRALRWPGKASLTDMLGLMMHLEQVKRVAPDVRKVNGFLNFANLSATLTRTEEELLTAASLGFVNYSLGRIDEVIPCVSTMIMLTEGDDAAYLIALKRYLCLKKQARSAAEIRSLLEYFHEKRLVDQLCGTIESGKNPLDRFTLHCDFHCKEQCPIYEKCCTLRINSLNEMIGQRQKALDFQAFCAGMDRLLS